jgi:hypothetical protein
MGSNIKRNNEKDHQGHNSSHKAKHSPDSGHNVNSPKTKRNHHPKQEEHDKRRSAMKSNSKSAFTSFAFALLIAGIAALSIRAGAIENRIDQRMNDRIDRQEVSRIDRNVREERKTDLRLDRNAGARIVRKIERRADRVTAMRIERRTRTLDRLARSVDRIEA